MIGGALARALRRDGHAVTAVPRDVPGLDGADAVVHLAGAPIGVRWTAARKRAILESRVAGTRRVVQAIARAAPRPRVLVCASAVGFYGDRGDDVLTEESRPGEDFLARVVLDWEQAARESPVRSVQMRFGIVLSPLGGALAKMLPAFRAGAGGRLGSGAQWMSWIALHDLVRAIRFAIGAEALAGARERGRATPGDQRGVHRHARPRPAAPRGHPRAGVRAPPAVRRNGRPHAPREPARGAVATRGGRVPVRPSAAARRRSATNSRPDRAVAAPCAAS